MKRPWLLSFCGCTGLYDFVPLLGWPPLVLVKVHLCVAGLAFVGAQSLRPVHPLCGVGGPLERVFELLG